MRIRDIKIYNSSSLDDQLEESMKEVYSKLGVQKKVAMTVWLNFYEIQKLQEFKTLEERVIYLREKGTIDKYIKSKYHIILNGMDKKNFVRKSIEEIKNKVGEICFKKSGLAIGEITKHELVEVEYSPIKGSSYADLPTNLKNKKALINIKNTEDDGCFRWCHLAHLYPPDSHPQRISKYKDKINTVDYTGIEFPVKIKDIPKIEELNSGIRFNVFRYVLGVKGACIHPVYISKKKTKNVCRLLLLEGEGKSHYVYIKDFSRLLSKESKNQYKKYFCDYCLQGFTKECILIHVLR